MAVETKDNQNTEESQQNPQPQDQTDSELNEDNISTYDPEQPENLDRILNMNVPIIVRIAKKKMKIGEVMKLNIGTVMQFEQDTYQYIDLMVNNEIIGLGQPVKISENFGLKITQLGDITHTIKSLGQASDSETI